MRNDQWGVEVCGRLQNCNDLVADEAIYHRQCHTKFFHKMRASTKSVGRPGDTSMKDIFKCLCDWLETVRNRTSDIKNFMKKCYLYLMVKMRTA